MKAVDMNQSKDTGLVLVLVLQIAAFYKTGSLLVLSSTGILLAVIVLPALFKPVAFLWFGLAEVLSRFFSSVLLTVLYFAVVSPVGLARRALGADAMQLKKYGSSGSGFTVREHEYSREDLKNPY